MSLDKEWANFQEYAAAQSPEWQKGWDDCKKAVKLFLLSEEGAAPRKPQLRNKTAEFLGECVEKGSLEEWLEEIVNE